MTKVYVLQEIGWEYNDEVNYRSESDGGIPRKVFKNKKKAEKACLEGNLNFFKQCSPVEYSYGDWYDVSSMDEDDASELLKTVFSDLPFDHVNDLFEVYWQPINVTDEQAKVMTKVFDKLGFYEVIEVECE